MTLEPKERTFYNEVFSTVVDQVLLTFDSDHRRGLQTADVTYTRNPFEHGKEIKNYGLHLVYKVLVPEINSFV